MITTNDVLTRLRNGESMDTIGQSIADVLNEAQEAYTAELAVKEKEAEAAAMAQAKRDMALDLIDIIQDYGRLVAPDAADILDDIDDDDVDAMIVTLDQMFHMMSSMAQLKVNLEKAQTKSHITPVAKHAKSDDEVLAKFIASLM
jgi:hypothetical protein